jgi:hypothetical protein
VVLCCVVVGVCGWVVGVVFWLGWCWDVCLCVWCVFE